MKWLERLRVWLILLLGGYADSSKQGLILHLVHSAIPDATWKAALRAVEKVAIDPSLDRKSVV